MFAELALNSQDLGQRIKAEAQIAKAKSPSANQPRIETPAPETNDEPKKEVVTTAADARTPVLTLISSTALA